jgi:hypothetical protein
MEKIFNQKNFNNFIWSPLGSRGNVYINFLPSSSLSDVCSLILFQLFATGVNDTGGKFAAGGVETGGNLPPALLTPAANLPPVSLTPVANLELRITPRNFEKIQNGLKHKGNWWQILPPVSLIPAAICHRCH